MHGTTIGRRVGGLMSYRDNGCCMNCMNGCWCMDSGWRMGSPTVSGPRANGGPWSSGPRSSCPWSSGPWGDRSVRSPRTDGPRYDGRLYSGNDDQRQYDYSDRELCRKNMVTRIVQFKSTASRNIQFSPSYWGGFGGGGTRSTHKSHTRKSSTVAARLFSDHIVVVEPL